MSACVDSPVGHQVRWGAGTERERRAWAEEPLGSSPGVKGLKGGWERQAWRRHLEVKWQFEFLLLSRGQTAIDIDEVGSGKSLIRANLEARAGDNEYQWVTWISARRAEEQEHQLCRVPETHMKIRKTFWKFLTRETNKNYAWVTLPHRC